MNAYLIFITMVMVAQGMLIYLLALEITHIRKVLNVGQLEKLIVDYDEKKA